MLAQKNRLPRELFDPVWKNGRRLSSPLFSFQYVPAPLGEARFSAVVSKKVSKTAVGRTRIRRRIYNALAKIIPNLGTPIHAAFHAKPPALNATAAETEREISELLIKASQFGPR